MDWISSAVRSWICSAISLLISSLKFTIFLYLLVISHAVRMYFPKYALPAYFSCASHRRMVSVSFSLMTGIPSSTSICAKTPSPSVSVPVKVPS